MNLNKLTISIFTGILLTSIIFSCLIIMSQSFYTMQMDHSDKSLDCCGAGSSNFINHLEPNMQNTLVSDSVVLTIINFISAFVIFIYIKSDLFASYFLIKDRYGGFKLFCKFTILFKNGILHPKLY